MRFMYLVKHPGPSVNPPAELLEAMHKLGNRNIWKLIAMKWLAWLRANKR